MSLLPGQILPQSTPIGRVNEDGTVTVDTNWWLLFYNLALQTLGNGSGLPADALIDLESADLDAIDADAIMLRQPLANALLLAQSTPDLSADMAKLQRDVTNATLLALTNDLDTVPLSSSTQLSNIANDTVLGNVSGAPALPSALNQTQLTALVNDFTALLSGAVPSGATTGQFLGAAGWTTTFSLSMTFSAGAVFANAQTLNWKNTGGLSNPVLRLHSDNNVYLDNLNTGGALNIRTNAGAATWAYSATGTLGCPGAIGVNGATPPSQSTGWGTPTGGAVSSNFAGGSASLATTTAAVAQLIAVLKAVGILGA